MVVFRLLNWDEHQPGSGLQPRGGAFLEGNRRAAVVNGRLASSDGSRDVSLFQKYELICIEADC